MFVSCIEILSHWEYIIIFVRAAQEGKAGLSPLLARWGKYSLTQPSRTRLWLEGLVEYLVPRKCSMDIC